MKVSIDKDKDKKKQKKEQSAIENYLFAVMEQSLKKCVDEALKDIFKEIK